MDEKHIHRRQPKIFNTPFETGVRSVILLTSCFPLWLNLQRILVFDHFVVHSKDIDGPSSLHPDEDFRVAEILVRRQLVESGLMLMISRSLINRKATIEGFKYQAGEDAGSYVDLLKDSYSIDLKERANWLAEHIAPLSDEALDQLVRSRIDRWAAEFQINNGKDA